MYSGVVVLLVMHACTSLYTLLYELLTIYYRKKGEKILLMQINCKLYIEFLFCVNCCVKVKRETHRDSHTLKETPAHTHTYVRTHTHSCAHIHMFKHPLNLWMRHMHSCTHKHRDQEKHNHTQRNRHTRTLSLSHTVKCPLNPTGREPFKDST